LHSERERSGNGAELGGTRAGIREVAWLDIAGGGQAVLDGNHAYIGHMDPPHGTSVLDVSDPANHASSKSIHHNESDRAT
jgi:hypothetical protein